jgi:hypothetical protein
MVMVGWSICPIAANRTMQRRIESPKSELEEYLARMEGSGGAGEGEEMGGVSVTSSAGS